MAKAQPFMTVTVSVSKRDLQYAAECLTDDLFAEFDSEVFEMLDFSGKEFREEMMTFQPFLNCVKEAVAQNGHDALECPYDYMDFYDVHVSKEWVKLYEVCEYMQTILNDTYNVDTTETDCEAAIETLKRAGFKIVKA